MRRGEVVKEPNLLIEAKQKFTRDEGIVWFWLLARAKFYKDFSLVKELMHTEIENLREEGKLFLAKSLIDLRELAEKYPEVFDRKTINYFKRVLRRMEKKVMFEVDIERYLKTMEELGYKDLVSNLKEKQKDIAYFGIATILQIVMTKDGKLEIVFSPYVSPLIFELKKRFTLYDFEEVLKLNSRSSIIMYRLLKEKLGLKFNSFQLTLEEIRHLFDLNEKTQASDIRNKYLEPAVKELNEKTSLRVEMKPIRRGRGGKIVGFHFKVWEIISPKGDLVDKIKELIETLSKDKALEVSPKELAEALLSLERVNPATALWFLLHYPEGEARLYAWEHIKWVELTPKIKYPDRYLESLITDKREELKWLLDQRTKDLIRKELEKLVEEGKGRKEEKPQENQPQPSENSEEDDELKELLGL